MTTMSKEDQSLAELVYSDADLDQLVREACDEDTSDLLATQPSPEERLAFATLYHEATGIQPWAILGPLIEGLRFEISPADLQGLEEVHRKGLPDGLVPAPEELTVMKDKDLIFTARSWRIVAAVHARPLGPGRSLAVCDIVEHDGEPQPRFFPAPLTAQRSVVCHAAVTHDQFKGHGITQRLIRERVLPYLRDREDTRSARWLTSSPMTYFVNVGRELCRSASLAVGLRLCDEIIFAERPAGYRTFGEVIADACAYFASRGLDFGEPAQAAAEPQCLYRTIYETLPTHKQLLTWRQEGAECEARAAYWQAQVHHLYHGLRDEGPRLQRAHRAAFCLLFLAAVLSQWCFDGDTGKPPDLVLAFHFANGARLHESTGPIPWSRPQDIAALGFGQILVYDQAWEERQRAYAELLAQRVRLGRKGVHLDVKGFAAQCQRLAAQLRAFLDPAEPLALASAYA